MSERDDYQTIDPFTANPFTTDCLGESFSPNKIKRNPITGSIIVKPILTETGDYCVMCGTKTLTIDAGKHYFEKEHCPDCDEEIMRMMSRGHGVILDF